MTLSAKIIPVTPFQQNCCLLYDPDTGRGVVIDPGGDVPDIIRVVEASGIAVDAIWLTHGHLDHAGGAMALKEALGVEIIGPHRADEMLLDRIEDQAAMFGVGGDYRNAKPDRWLEEGDRLSIGDHVFDVIHAPGHSPGHIALFDATARLLVAGDVIFAGSIGRTDLPGGDHATLMASIADKIMPLGDDVGFICGHGPGGRLGQERLTNPFLR